MLDKLRRRLTLLFSLLTAAVLAGALAVTCRLARSEARTADDLLFARTVTAVESAVADANLVQDACLARQEVEGRLVLYLEDNGLPLAFPGGWTPAGGRAPLIAAAREQAAAAGLDPTRLRRQQVEFALTGTAGVWRCTALVLPHTPSHSATAVYILRDMGALNARLRAMTWQYAGLWALGAALLAAACRWMVGRALRPTARALREQREFVAAAGHELRSPLAVLKAGLQAARDPATAAAAPDFLRAAEGEVDRLSRLTDDLLILAGGDAGVLAAALAPVETDTFLIELYDRFAPLARARGHNLALHLPDAPLPALRADAGRLAQLFGVLLDNAFEYAPPGTPVELCAESLPGGGVRIAVIDHGPGVPDADKPRIFARFTRGDPSRTDKAHFGLGLAVAAEIAALHAATLRVTDTPGGGATFLLEWRTRPR